MDEENLSNSEKVETNVYRQYFHPTIAKKLEDQLQILIDNGLSDLIVPPTNPPPYVSFSHLFYFISNQ